MSTQSGKAVFLSESKGIFDRIRNEDWKGGVYVPTPPDSPRTQSPVDMPQELEHDSDSIDELKDGISETENLNGEKSEPASNTLESNNLKTKVVPMGNFPGIGIFSCADFKRF